MMRMSRLLMGVRHDERYGDADDSIRTVSHRMMDMHVDVGGISMTAAMSLVSLRTDLLADRCEVCRGGWLEFCGGLCICGDSLFLLSLLE